MRSAAVDALAAPVRAMARCYTAAGWHLLALDRRGAAYVTGATVSLVRVGQAFTMHGGSSQAAAVVNAAVWAWCMTRWLATPRLALAAGNRADPVTRVLTGMYVAVWWGTTATACIELAGGGRVGPVAVEWWTAATYPAVLAMFIKDDDGDRGEPAIRRARSAIRRAVESFDQVPAPAAP